MNAVQATTGSARPPWLVRRLFPVLATVIMAAIGMAGTIWGPRYYGKTPWAVPDDLWGTLIAAQRLLHLNLGGLYTAPTELVSLPGAAVILVPAAAWPINRHCPHFVPGQQLEPGFGDVPTLSTHM